MPVFLFFLLLGVYDHPVYRLGLGVWFAQAAALMFAVLPVANVALRMLVSWGEPCWSLIPKTCCEQVMHCRFVDSSRIPAMSGMLEVSRCCQTAAAVRA